MSKKQATYVILASIVLSLFINIFFGRFLSAEISTIPLLNRWKILSPLAPIVINTREEVRVNDTADLLKVVSLARPKLSGIITVSDGQPFLIGGAQNLTSDGLFLSSKAVLAGNKPENLYIKTDDGAIAQVTAAYPDPATNLVILKAALNNVSVANIGTSANLTAGEKIIFLAPTLKDFSPSFQASYVARDQFSDYAAIFDSDKPRQTFEAQSTGALILGQAIVNLNGEVIGIWDGSSIIPGDLLKDFINDFFGNGNKTIRPSFGFQYRNISASETKLGNLPFGAIITKIDAGSAAQKAGLEDNDIITAVNDAQLAANNPLNGFLAKYNRGDSVKLTVMRGKDRININLAVGELK